jgi:hypothetical protein
MVTATVTNVIPAVLPGIYPARFDAIEARTNEQGEFWYWTFTLAVPDGKIGDPEQFHADPDSGNALIPVTATSSARITPKTKAANWIQALRGSPVVVDEEIDFDSLLTMTCQALIEITDTGYSRIAQLIPNG